MPETGTDLDFNCLASDRARAIDASGIRRMFELAAGLENPINLTIGQPCFPVPRSIKDAVINAIESDDNGYTVTQGGPAALRSVKRQVSKDIGWSCDGTRTAAMLTSGTSGGLMLAALALLQEGDELIIPDPWFVLYPKLATLTGAKAVLCDTYPDFKLTAERVAPLITDRTKALILASPGNPTGVVLDSEELSKLVRLCQEHGVLLISDEIYDEFTYQDALEDGVCPSAARLWDQVLLIRGLGKTYSCTGWRLGYAAGPAGLIDEMTKLQQFTYVCAPSMAQAAFEATEQVSMRKHVDEYQQRRDLVVQELGALTDVVVPGGAFYAFVAVPESLDLTGTQFAEKALEHRVLVVPGAVFSQRDTHFRISYAVTPEKLAEGLGILRALLTK
jgi:aspartate/methionine/tyrosine aminotransferase